MSINNPSAYEQVRVPGRQLMTRIKDDPAFKRQV